jgi:hypothetical protein
MITLIRHLLPKSETWSLTVDRPLARFWSGVGEFVNDARIKLDDVLLEFFPDFTSDPFYQLERLGFSRAYITHLSTERARSMLIEIRKQGTNMSPFRLEGILRAAGFDAYVHEWWASGPPWIERGPTDYMVRPQTGGVRCGMTTARCGVPSARCSNFLINDPNYLVNETLSGKAPPWVPESGYRGVFYVGGEVFPETVTVASEDRTLFEYLILRYKRASQWAVLLAEYVPELGTEDGGLLLTEDGAPIIIEG